jgi:hypothetical protein
VRYKFSARTIFILGVPRSGTSWLAKILDSHPDVLYRHEPDIVLRNSTLPSHCEPGEAAKLNACKAGDWLNALAALSNPRTAGERPIFRKSYHTARQTAVRKAIITFSKIAEGARLMKNVIGSIKIPDFVDLDSAAYSKLVLKSVSSIARIPLLLEAAPEAHFIHIIRHPCGQVASVLRGFRSSRFEHEFSVADVGEVVQARRRSLFPDDLANMSVPA